MNGRRRKGQSILEYVIILTAIVGGVIYGARHVLQPAVWRLFSSAGRVIRYSSELLAERVIGDGYGRNLQLPDGMLPVEARMVDRLGRTAAGRYYRDLVEESDIDLTYLDYKKFNLNPQSAVFWSADSNQIVVNSRMAGFPEAMAAFLAHAGVHADYSHNPEKWTADTLTRHPELTPDILHITRSPGNSVDQEYNAFKAQVAVWDDVKRGEANSANDGWTAVLAQGEDDARVFIRQAYTDVHLPEF